MFSALVETAGAPPAEHISGPAPSALDALKLSRQGKGPSRRLSSSSPIAGSSRALGPVLDLMNMGEGCPGMFPGELFQVAHWAID